MSSIEKVKEYLKIFGAAEGVQEFEVSSATVELAAKALGVEPARIAKSLTFGEKEGGCIMVVAAGDAKINNGMFKRRFGCKPSMLPAEEVLRLTGHAVGGVCPFALPEEVPVYLDESLQRFVTVFPAAGSYIVGRQIAVFFIVPFFSQGGVRRGQIVYSFERPMTRAIWTTIASFCTLIDNH